jgi:hypothetical protein
VIFAVLQHKPPLVWYSEGTDRNLNYVVLQGIKFWNAGCFYSRRVIQTMMLVSLKPYNCLCVVDKITNVWISTTIFSLTFWLEINVTLFYDSFIQSTIYFYKYVLMPVAKNCQTLQDALAMWRNFFVDLVAHEANAWRKHLPSIVKHYLRRITGKNIE